MNFLSIEDLKTFLDEKYNQYNRPEFVETDPIQIPHSFTATEDIEIAAFMSASIAWGQRNTIITNARKIMKLMGRSPYDFVMNAEADDFDNFRYFKHRTFNDIDCIFYLQSLQNIYRIHGGLRKVFEAGYLRNKSVKDALIHFRKIFFEIEYPQRTQKHIADVAKNSAAKRLNMFLMWMVRNDNRGVHFGLWNKIPSSALYLPLDVHTGNVGRKFGLLTRKQNDWKAVEEITTSLREFDPEDPVKYDFALFCLGVFEKF